MHKIYVDEGKFDFLYQIPIIIYSDIISSIISSFLEYLSLPEDAIIEIKNNKNRSQFNDTKKCIKIKLILYFIFDFLLLLFLWYYVSCFGVVYKNTQIHLIKDTLISFGLSLLYPFGLCLLSGIFRIIALRAQKQNQECLYKFSQIIDKVVSFFM